ncbi:MAG: ATP-binding protein [Phycisphaerales bacterium]|nr:ATP-binding protein [Phycisphaerales bacterium]
MLKDYSPFTPGVPVAPEMFAGKRDEIESMLSSCRAAQRGKFMRTFVIGERGIGKSSLCNFVLERADNQLSMLALHVYLGGVKTIEQLAERVFTELARSSQKRPWYARLKESLGRHIEEVGLFGVSIGFKATQEELRNLAWELPWQLDAFVHQLKGERKGILLILDDINGLASSDEFANWLKSFVDTVATKRPVPMHLVLAGLPERRASLLKSQPSLDRVFDLLETKPISPEESRQFFVSTFNSGGVSIDNSAAEMLAKYSGGLPVLMHEVGDAVFKQASTSRVNTDMAFVGLMSAATVVGRKYLDSGVLDVIQSEKYRSILLKLAQSLEEKTLRRKEVLKLISTTELKVFDNFVRKMVDLGVLRAVRPGEYEFCNELHRLYYVLSGSNRLKK